MLEEVSPLINIPPRARNRRLTAGCRALPIDSQGVETFLLLALAVDLPRRLARPLFGVLRLPQPLPCPRLVRYNVVDIARGGGFGVWKGRREGRGSEELGALEEEVGVQGGYEADVRQQRVCQKGQSTPPPPSFFSFRISI